MKIVSTVCPNCGASIQVDMDKKNLTCNYCGNNLYLDDEVQHIQYDNAEETGYQFEKGRQRAQAESRQANYQQYNVPIQQQPVKKRKTWLWVLGWIFIFPLPLTILLVRKKEMNPILKYGIIAVAWLFYLIIGFSGGSNDSGKNNNSNSGVTTIDETADSSEASAENDQIVVEKSSESSVDSDKQEITDNNEVLEKKITLENISYVELDELQQLFVSLATFSDRDEVNSYVTEHGLSVNWFGGFHYNASSCYIGLNSKAVSDRSRDREGEVIDVEFQNDGKIDKFGYLLDGTVTFFDKLELTYENGQFHYDGETYDDGEAAMQLYLANNGVTREETSNANSENEIDVFVSLINDSGSVNLEFVEDFVPSDKSSSHYKTEFRLNAYKDALGKSYKYGDTTVDIILSSSGAIERIYMDGATYEQCENMIRYASPLLDTTVTEADIQETVDYLAENKSANGYYYAKLGLLMLGGGDKGYEFMLKLS